MAQGWSSAWTKMGSNAKHASTSPDTDSGGAAGTMPAIDTASNGGRNAQVRRECSMWLTGTGKSYTPHFDWNVDSNFTIVLNATKETLDVDPGDIDVMVEGSIDGVSYVTLRDLVDWNINDSGYTVGHTVYSLTDYGKLPYMRISLEPSTAASTGNDDDPIKIVVIPHHTS